MTSRLLAAVACSQASATRYRTSDETDCPFSAKPDGVAELRLIPGSYSPPSKNPIPEAAPVTMRLFQPSLSSLSPKNGRRYFRVVTARKKPHWLSLRDLLHAAHPRTIGLTEQDALAAKNLVVGHRAGKKRAMSVSQLSRESKQPMIRPCTTIPPMPPSVRQCHSTLMTRAALTPLR